ALGGSEKWAADSVQAVGGATVTVRYHPLITEQCRIIKDGAVYLIVSVNDPTQKRQWLQITVKAAVNG
ncbi:MAG: head-tail adaptor protein, partial [Clostridia bacterium]|nr:head-tail adaptor protein [Clostridia bacterium]